MDPAVLLPQLWHHLFWPLLRLLGYISIGLLVANFIEALNWTRKIAVVARPLTRFAHLPPLSGAAFSMAFFSGVAANTMLSEGFDQGRLSRKELILANLFNSLPTYFLHLPTTFCITAPLIKGAAFVYIGLTLGAALLRTLAVSVISRLLLPPNPDYTITDSPDQGRDLRSAWARTWQRFKRRIRKIIRFTIPIYILFFFLSRLGLFERIDAFLAAHLHFLAWLSPQSVSIIGLQVAAEFTAGLAAAGAMLADGIMDQRQIVLALLVGNILSSPVRAFRHQFPYYAGIFKPRMAMLLILCSQTFRLTSIIAVTVLYLLLG